MPHPPVPPPPPPRAPPRVECALAVRLAGRRDDLGVPGARRIGRRVPAVAPPPPWHGEDWPRSWSCGLPGGCPTGPNTPPPPPLVLEPATERTKSAAERYGDLPPDTRHVTTSGTARSPVKRKPGHRMHGPQVPQRRSRLMSPARQDRIPTAMGYSAQWRSSRHVGPDPRGLGSARARGLHLDRRVIGKDRRTPQHMAADRIGQRLQQGCRLADPVAERRAVQVDALALEDLALGDTRESESRGGISPPRAPRTVREPLGSYGSQRSAVVMHQRPVGKQSGRCPDDPCQPGPGALGSLPKALELASCPPNEKRVDPP